MSSTLSFEENPAFAYLLYNILLNFLFSSFLKKNPTKDEYNAFCKVCVRECMIKQTVSDKYNEWIRHFLISKLIEGKSGFPNAFTWKVFCFLYMRDCHSGFLGIAQYVDWEYDKLKGFVFTLTLNPEIKYKEEEDSLSIYSFKKISEEMNAMIQSIRDIRSVDSFDEFHAKYSSMENSFLTESLMSILPDQFPDRDGAEKWLCDNNFLMNKEKVFIMCKTCAIRLG
jgi:hypothetical protein